MKNQTNFLGMLMRNERLNRGLELKDVADGICASSYLCKIELGQAKPSQTLIQDLFDRLKLSYEQDDNFLHEMQLIIDRVYEGIFYKRDLKYELKKLHQNEARIRTSPLRLSYDITTGYLSERVNDELEALVPYMDDRELAMYLLSLIDFENRPPLAQVKRIDNLLQNSFSLLTYMQACLQNNRFEEIKSLGDQCIARSLNEGNLNTLIQANLLIGTGYASEGHLSVAIAYYERAARLIKSSIWPSLESSINYNLGASYLEIGNVEKANELLQKVPRSYGFYLFHKLAWLALVDGDKAVAQYELDEMKKIINKDRIRRQIYEATAIQLKENYELDPDSLSVIEALIDCLKESKHIGYLRFHRALITKVFIAHRKYKQAYEYERMLGDCTRRPG